MRNHGDAIVESSIEATSRKPGSTAQRNGSCELDVGLRLLARFSRTMDTHTPNAAFLGRVDYTAAIEPRTEERES